MTAIDTHPSEMMTALPRGPLIERRAEAVVVTVPAKINLALLVKHKRPDGYHEIESLVVGVSLTDRITCRGPCHDRLTFGYTGERSPADPSNLVHRAARALATEFGPAPGGQVSVEKAIPAGTGLGGGSADAAATLAGLNTLWHLGRSNDELARLGATIGADVPLFFHLPAAHVSGLGEKVSPVEFAWNGYVMLARPDIDVSTPTVYREWRDADRSEIESLESLIAARNHDAMTLSSGLANALEPPAFRAYPALEAANRRIAALADRPIRMTGSGSGMFALFDDRAGAEDLAARIRSELSIRAWVLRLWPQGFNNRSAS